MSQGTVPAVADQAPKLPAMMAGAKAQPIVPTSFEDAYRFATAVVKARMVPKGIDTAEAAMVVIMHGLEVGLTPMAALQSIANINNRPSIWGDGALALVQASGLISDFSEIYVGDEKDDTFKAVCTIRRRGRTDPIIGEFSIADAKNARLWKKDGPWTQYPKRMLKMRARSWALRDGFSDVLRGLHIAEEAMDVPEMKDVTPKRGADDIAAKLQAAKGAREGFSQEVFDAEVASVSEPSQEPGDGRDGESDTGVAETVETVPGRAAAAAGGGDGSGGGDDKVADLIAVIASDLENCSTPADVQDVNHQYAEAINGLSGADCDRLLDMIAAAMKRVGGR